MSGSADGSGLLERHLEFVRALRTAGLPVSLSEDLDSVTALSRVPWSNRAMVRDTYAATLVKKHSQRSTFDALFDLYFPAMVGAGAGGSQASDRPAEKLVGDNLDVLDSMRGRIRRALRESDLDDQLLRQLATESVGHFGTDARRTHGASPWSAYETLQRLDVQQLVNQLVEGLMRDGVEGEQADGFAQRRLTAFISAVHADIERRTVEREGPARRAAEQVRPTIDKLAFSDARHADLTAMRREVYQLARRLATRLAKERRSRGGGPVDFRRTIRASMATGGVPLTTHHRPKRPHRTDLVVLCDVSGSVAHFAHFTLMFVYALREAFQGMRAFTFVDDVHEVTDELRPGAGPDEVIAGLAGSTREAVLAGRTHYGRVFDRFAAEHGEAVGPRTTLLILGDARANYASLGDDALRELAAAAKRTIWLNPEPERSWGLGDSAAMVYRDIVEMAECRNLEQLAGFVHDLV